MQYVAMETQKRSASWWIYYIFNCLFMKAVFLSFPEMYHSALSSKTIHLRKNGYSAHGLDVYSTYCIT